MLARILCWLLGHDWLHSPYQMDPAAYHAINLWCSRCGRQESKEHHYEEVEKHVCPDYSKEIEALKTELSAREGEAQKWSEYAAQLQREIHDLQVRLSQACGTPTWRPLGQGTWSDAELRKMREEFVRQYRQNGPTL